MVERNALSKIAFRSGSPLGAGHFGTVRRAMMAPHGDVAVKVLDCQEMASRLGLTDWNDLRNHLFAEAENLKKAEHRNVVRVFGVHYSPSKSEVYIVTELCDESVESGLADGPLDLEDAKRRLSGALAGLEALHVRGMVHRDLKPGNILMKGTEAKLSDFGLVTDRIVAGYASAQGYLEHLAPEYFFAHLTSTRTDVWALGMTAYRMLSGVCWYEEVRGRLGVDWSKPNMSQHVAGLLKSGAWSRGLKGAWLPHIPQEWRRFVARALHQDVAKRFRDAGEMLTAVAGLPTSGGWTCRFSPSQVVWKRARGPREQVVVWDRTPHLASVRAFSKSASGPDGEKVLMRERPVEGRKAALAALQDFFATRSS